MQKLMEGMETKPTGMGDPGTSPSAGKPPLTPSSPAALNAPPNARTAGENAPVPESSIPLPLPVPKPENRQISQPGSAETANPAEPAASDPKGTREEGGKNPRKEAGSDVSPGEKIAGREHGTATANAATSMNNREKSPSAGLSSESEVLADAANRATGQTKSRVAEPTPAGSEGSHNPEVPGNRVVAKVTPVPYSQADSPETDTSQNAERLSRLIVRETALIRRSGAETMVVVLKPDRETELVLHVNRMQGQLEAVIRMERGDFSGLSQQWNQLQESLSKQNIRLAPLTDAHQSAVSSDASGSGNAHDRESRNRWEEDPSQAAPSGKSRIGTGSGSHAVTRHEPITNSRESTLPSDGWETWA